MKSLFLSLFLISFSFTQVFSSYDYIGSRATAMSGAVTSGPGGSWSIFHNPAQLTDLNGLNLVSGYSQIFNLSFLPYYNFGFSYNLFSNYFDNSFSFNSTSISPLELTRSSTSKVDFKVALLFIVNDFIISFYY